MRRHEITFFTQSKQKGDRQNAHHDDRVKSIVSIPKKKASSKNVLFLVQGDLIQ